jgi:hypothetical protein
MVVDNQIVQDHEQPPAWKASPQANENFCDFPDALPAVEHTVQVIAMHIVQSEKLLGASQGAGSTDRASG